MNLFISLIKHRQRGIVLEDRRNSLNEKILKKEKKKKDKKDKKEKKEKKEKKKKSKSSGDQSDDTKKKKKPHSHIESLEDDLNSPCCSGIQSASHSRHNSEGEAPPPHILPDSLQHQVTNSIGTLNINHTSVENSSSGEIVSTEPEPFERLPSPSSRGATPPLERNFTTTMSESVPEVPAEEVAPAAPRPAEAPARDSPPLQPEPEVEREPPILFRDDLDVSTGMIDEDAVDAEFELLWSQLLESGLPRSRSLSPCLSVSSPSSCSDLDVASTSSSSYSSPLFFYSSSSSLSSSLSTSCSSLSDSSSSSHSSAKNSVSSSLSSKSYDSDINNNSNNTINHSDRSFSNSPQITSLDHENNNSNNNTQLDTSFSNSPQVTSPVNNCNNNNNNNKNRSDRPFSNSPQITSPVTNLNPSLTNSSTPPCTMEQNSASSLSRSSTAASDLSACSSTSGLSFGSSYYVLYVVDPAGRVPTPQDLPSSPEGSPSPPLISRCNSAMSISSVDTMRTVTPDQQYFEINNAAFRRMHGISRASSYESCLTFLSRSRSRSLDSCSTLQFNSFSQEQPKTNKNSILSPIPSSVQSPKTQSQPSSPVPHHPVPSRACSFESITSFLRRVPRAPSSVRSISTFDLAPMSQSTSPVPRNEAYPDRPPSTDSPILLASPDGSLHGSQESVMVYRPVPRYNYIDPGSPEPQAALLCYLGPPRPYEPPLIFTDVAQQVGIC